MVKVRFHLAAGNPSAQITQVLTADHRAAVPRPGQHGFQGFRFSMTIPAKAVARMETGVLCFEVSPRKDRRVVLKSSPSGCSAIPCVRHWARSFVSHTERKAEREPRT